MTAIAQCGKSLPLEFGCSEAVVEELATPEMSPDVAVGIPEDVEDANEADDDIDAATESAYVVWTAVKVGCAIWFPLRVVPLGMRTQ